MKEKAIQFGRTAVLTGVLAEPDDPGSSGGRPAFLLLNAGILHRVGAGRLHVRLARELGRHGFTSLRFDFSGIGDSEPRKDSLSFEESSQIEVREAMDYLASSRGIEKFVLMGLCSGADMAHLTARNDPRVQGLVFIDAWAYRTARYWFHHYSRRVFKPEVWKRWLSVRARRMLGELSAMRQPAQSNDAVAYEVPKYVRRFPERHVVAADLKGFMSRGVHLLNFFTGGLADHYNHASQYRSSFSDVNFGPHLQVEFMPEADHILNSIEHQMAVVGMVRDWANSHFSPEAVESASASRVLTTERRYSAAAPA